MGTGSTGSYFGKTIVIGGFLKEETLLNGFGYLLFRLFHLRDCFVYGRDGEFASTINTDIYQCFF
jgi:hypothetical protein